MKPEIIILILNIYEPWNINDPEQTETIVIPNDEYADLNAQNLISMFIREVLKFDWLPSELSEVITEYSITNEEIEIPVAMPTGEWLVTVSAEYSNIKPYNQPNQKG